MSKLIFVFLLNTSYHSIFVVETWREHAFLRNLLFQNHVQRNNIENRGNVTKVAGQWGK